MNKNNIIGFLLIAVVLIGFSWYNQPSAEEQRAAFVQDSVAAVQHDFQIVIEKADQAKTKRQKQHRNHFRSLFPEKEGNCGKRRQKHHAAHRRGSRFFLVARHTFFPLLLPRFDFSQKRDQNRPQRQADAKAKVEADSTALFYSALKGQAKKIVLKNEKVELTLNTKGATVEKAVIKGYVGHNLQVKDGSADAKDVTLFDGNDQSLKFMLEAKGYGYYYWHGWRCCRWSGSR